MTDNVDCLLCVDTNDPHVLAHTAAGYVRVMIDAEGRTIADCYAIVPWAHHVALSFLENDGCGDPIEEMKKLGLIDLPY